MGCMANAEDGRSKVWARADMAPLSDMVQGPVWRQMGAVLALARARSAVVWATLSRKYSGKANAGATSAPSAWA